MQFSCYPLLCSFPSLYADATQSVQDTIIIIKLNRMKSILSVHFVSMVVLSHPKLIKSFAKINCYVIIPIRIINELWIKVHCTNLIWILLDQNCVSQWRISVHHDGDLSTFQCQAIRKERFMCSQWVLLNTCESLKCVCFFFFMFIESKLSILVPKWASFGSILPAGRNST